MSHREKKVTCIGGEKYIGGENSQELDHEYSMPDKLFQSLYKKLVKSSNGSLELRNAVPSVL